ncbi:MAG TPA: hypothetical protein VF559_11245 [Caulobacteraceae bacterium]|jgi:hypothetical protein
MIAVVMAVALALPRLPHISPPRLPSIPLPSPSRLLDAIPDSIRPHRHEWAEREWEESHDPHGEPLAKVEYRQVGPYVLVPVRLNEEGPYWFALDSGASRSVIDARLLRPAKLGVRNTAAISPHGALVRRLWAVNLEVAGSPVFAPEPVALDFAKTRYPKGVQGLIGRELFQAYVVRIDPDRRTVALYQPSMYRPGQTPAVELTARDGGFYAPVMVTAKAGAPVEKPARLETAWPEELTDEAVRQGSGVKRGLVGARAAEPYWGQVGQVRALQMGPHTLYNVWGATGETRVGAGWLNRFIVTFDAPHGRLYLEPTSRTYVPSAPAA